MEVLMGSTFSAYSGNTGRLTRDSRNSTDKPKPSAPVSGKALKKPQKDSHRHNVLECLPVSNPIGLEAIMAKLKIRAELGKKGARISAHDVYGILKRFEREGHALWKPENGVDRWIKVRT
jgi:hypothetical protein